MVTQGYDKHTQTFYLRSDDPKPSGVENGTRIIEVDTGRDYRFDAENSTWRNIQHGGDTPSPSGDPHFSSLKYLYTYFDGGTDTFNILYAENGEYSVPKSAFSEIETANNPTVICLTPVKSLTIPSDIDEYTLAVVQFTPDSNFSTEFTIEGEITNGDGKIYQAGIGLMDGQLFSQAFNTGIDFTPAIIE